MRKIKIASSHTANLLLFFASMSAIGILGACQDMKALAIQANESARKELQAKHYKEAGEQWNRAWELDKSKTIYRTKYAYCLALQGQFSRAEFIWRELAKSSDNDTAEEAKDALTNLLPRLKKIVAAKNRR